MRPFAVLCLLVPSLFAQPPARTHDITLDDYFTLDIITQFQLSPDGKHVAYVVARWDKSSDGRKVDLWLVETESRKSLIWASVAWNGSTRNG